MKLEIKFRNNTNLWLRVNREIFRSWCGERRINEKIYIGKVYYFLTNKISMNDK